MSDLFVAPSTWHTLDSARDSWVDALHIDDDVLNELLLTARVLCEAYAPAVVGGVVPVNYRQAQLLQARDIYNAVKTDPDGSIGADGFSIPVFSMSRVVKGLLRPKRVVPHVT